MDFLRERERAGRWTGRVSGGLSDRLAVEDGVSCGQLHLSLPRPETEQHLLAT